MAKKQSDLPRGLYYKDGIIWLTIGHNGKTYRESTGTTSVKEALEVRKRRLSEIVSGEKANTNTALTTCADLLNNYLARLERTSKEDSQTYENTKGTVNKHVIPYFGDTRADKVDRKRLEKYRDLKIKTLSQVSINRHLGYLRTAFKHGKSDKLTNNAPDFSTTILKSAEEENVRTGIVTKEQYSNLLDCFGDDIHVKTLFMLCWNTGVRPAEAFRLEWSQVDRQNRLISVHKRQGKIGKPRFLPLRYEVFKQLMDWESYLTATVKRPKYIFTHPVTTKRMKKDDYRTPWHQACLAAGYAKQARVNGRLTIESDLLFYDSRRAFRTYLPEEINPSDGKMVMGQTQESTYGRYHDSKVAATRVLAKMEAGESQTESEPLLAQTQPKMISVLDRITAIKELGTLLGAGHITQEEFATMKAAL